MQTTRIPESVNQEIDKLNGKFVWGSNETKNKIHLVSWEKLCSSKEEGGLGLRSMGLMNKALMARMGWKLVTDPDSLWASILGSKYLNNSSFFNCEANSKSSYTWRSILIFQRGRTSGSKWVIWKGQRAKFWLDWWVGEGPLVDIATQQIPPASLNARVFDYIDEDGNWKFSDFVELISMNLIPHIRAIKPFKEDNCTDSLILRDSPSQVEISVRNPPMP